MLAADRTVLPGRNDLDESLTATFAIVFAHTKTLQRLRLQVSLVPAFAKPSNTIKNG